ncbi:hypothetical protein BGW36DRAFT_363959 [Talaromyces proteolyticus]|uniref:Mid2 domain-containing protein n=1 Tax=Talaromyces proteolyticus TaxID=1131652 RepID=A0AAD4KGB1_9EURO|nr:uncharacterized protein BGW36DRAFT_363959 [Talaromyces proteolyticus]KAH8691633.1 hypothetical protein BGW36DRAFT_363959 [Talaromyces proteolyticus]
MKLNILAVVFPSLTIALRAPVPDATAHPHGQLLAQYPQPTASFDDNEFHAAVRRDTTGSFTAIPTSGSLSTSYAPASLCGWVGQDPTNNVFCADDEKCVFHAPNSAWPGMGGCCPNNDDSNCGFESTCYDSFELASTPALLATNNPFAIYCTESASRNCVTWYYIQLGITDYGCGTAYEFETVYTDATLTTDHDTYVTMVSVSYVPDALLQQFANGGSTMSTEPGKITTSGKASTATSLPTVPATSAPAAATSVTSSSSSTPVGAIVGGVVGGVVGLGAIAGACFVAWLWMKRKKENNPIEMSSRNSTQPGGYQSVPQYQLPQSWDNATSTFSEAGAKEVRKGPTELPDGPIIEIDSNNRNVVTELPTTEPSQTSH